MKHSLSRKALIASLELENISKDKALNLWSKYEKGIEKSVKIHGPKHTVTLQKSYYEFLRNRILHLPPKSLSFVKTDKYGLPKPL
jgi:hypothetical protein